MSAQLDLFAQKRKPALNGPALAGKLYAILHAKARWVNRRELTAEHGFSKDGREARLGRACSHGKIMAGQRGYRLRAQATPEEYRAARNTLTSQIEALQEQHAMLCKVGHRVFATGADRKDG